MSARDQAYWLLTVEKQLAVGGRGDAVGRARNGGSRNKNGSRLLMLQRISAVMMDARTELGQLVIGSGRRWEAGKKNRQDTAGAQDQEALVPMFEVALG